MSKKEILTLAVETAKSKVTELRQMKFDTKTAALENNTRANRKVAHSAEIDYNRASEHLAQLTGALAVASAEKEYSFPRKAATINGGKKATKVFKPVRHPAHATPKPAETTGNPEWAEKKAADKAAKLASKPVIGRKPTKPVVCGKIEDDYQAYLIECAWQAIEAGDDAGWDALAVLLPDGGVSNPETVKLEADEFFAEKKHVAQFDNAIAALKVEFERLDAKVEKAKAKLDKVTARVRVAKMMVTKATKAYLAADEGEKAERYERMMERKRHLSVQSGLQVAAQKEYDVRLRIRNAFADSWDAKEAELLELKARAEAKLAAAKRAHKHDRIQKALDEAFGMRYERAEWVPTKESNGKYKVYNVSVHALYGNLQLLHEMEELADEQCPGYVEQGKKLFAQFVDQLRGESGPFKVNARDCVVNNVASSAMSDLMGVEYGLRTPCKEMVLVNYDLTNTFKVYWKFVSGDYNKAQTIIHNLRVFVARRLIRYGIELDDGDKALFYKLLASNNTQQKKGQAYMGEVNTMKRTEKLREFGWSMDAAIEGRTDNAAEWLKRNATLTTPSVMLKGKDGKLVKVTRILMVDDVEIERLFDNVTVIDAETDANGQQKLIFAKNQAKKLKLTMFDGQALWLKNGMPTTQGRGPALKFMAIAKPNYQLPEFARDIMGNIVRVADYDILMTKSCWKAAKMGMNWYQYRNAITELAKDCEGYDVLRAVRYSDREIGDEENPRNLARQATQQWVKADDEIVEKLTRKSRRWLKANKQYRVILAMLCELDRPEEERSALARLFAKFPQLILHPWVKQWLSNRWTAKRNKACSGRLRTEGMYPYICQDPVAMIQICLEGRDPNADDLGVLAADEVNLPKVEDGKEVYCIRYPANYLVGMVRKQKNVAEFNGLGNVAVLPYYGDTIARADGDFDGDEMLFLFSKTIIETMKEAIKMFNPGLIDFPHGKVACNKPFGSYKEFESQVAEALVRAQEFNLVGLYSNLAVLCLQNASMATDGKVCQKWLNAAIFAHVGAIVCLDMVKGADVPQVLLNKLSELNKNVRSKQKMPWNQQFSHPETEVEDRTNSVQDRIAGTIFDEHPEFEIEFEEGEEIDFDPEILRHLIPANRTTSFRRLRLSDKALRILRGCRYEDAGDKKAWAELDATGEIGWKELLVLGWHNASSILWKLSGVDMAEKRNELNWFIREQLMDNVRREWNGKSIETRYATTIKSIVTDALGFSIPESGDDAGKLVAKKNSIDNERKGSYLMFVLRILAEDILAVANAGGIVSEELAQTMSAPRKEEEMDVPACVDELDDDLLALVNGQVWLTCDDEEPPMPTDEDLAAMDWGF